MTFGKAALINEWRVLCRHPLIWVTVGGAAIFSALVVSGSPSDPADGAAAALKWLNLFFPTFVLPFVAGALAAIFYLRELDHDMAEIVGAYPVSPRSWLVMRVGSFFLLLISVCILAEACFIVMLLADFPDQLGEMVRHGLVWLLLIHAPACLIWASILAWIACRRANSGLLYFAAGIGWLAYMALSTLSGTPMISGSFVPWPPLKQVMLVLDPYAATALLNPMPQTGLLQSREANIVVGRMLWVLVCGLLLLSIKSVPVHTGRKSERKLASRALLFRRTSGPIGLHLGFVVRDKVFPLLVLGWIALLIPEVVGGMGYAEPLSRVAPDSRDALNRVVWDLVIGAGSILLLYVSDRICRLYPTTRMQELYAATPHRPLALVWVQLVSLSIMAIFFVLLAGLAVLVAQLLTKSPIQAGEYGEQLGLALSRLLVMGGLFVAAHGLLRQRYLANLAGLLVVILGLSSLAPSIGLHHPLWRPVATPLTVPDHLWGYGGSLFGHWQFMLFWAAIAQAALLVAVAIHHRALPFAQVRLRTIWRQTPMIVAILMVFGAVMQGARISHALRTEGALISAEERNQRRAEYERRYRSWNGVAQPVVEAIEARVDFFPQDQRVRLAARLRLTNRSTAPITRLLVGRSIRETSAGEIRFAGAEVQQNDVELGQTIYKLDRPLQPGQHIVLNFATEVTQSGLAPADFPLVLRPEFSAFPAKDLLPVIGFEPQFMLRDDTNRRDQGLPPLNMVPPSRLSTSAPNSARNDQVMLDSIVSTDARHYILAQGKSVRTWQRDGRKYVHYRTERPIRYMPAYFSVPWKPSLWRVGDHDLQIFAPNMTASTKHNLLGMRDTLLWLDRDVAPYPGTTLSLIAAPELGFTGYAMPQIVEVSHRVAFRAEQTSDAGFNQIYRRAAHETAHQWFGHLLGHGIREERAFLVESLAKYAELVMVERRYGKPTMQALVDFEYDRYRQQRIDPKRPVLPLIDADDSVDMYSRATLAFSCLRGKIGDRPIIASLNGLAVEQQSGRAVRSIDFVQRLIETSPPAMKHTIERLFLGTEPVEQQMADLDCSAKP